MWLVEVLPAVVLVSLIASIIVVASFLILVAWRTMRERRASRVEKRVVRTLA